MSTLEKFKTFKESQVNPKLQAVIVEGTITKESYLDMARLACARRTDWLALRQQLYAESHRYPERAEAIHEVIEMQEAQLQSQYELVIRLVELVEG